MRIGNGLGSGQVDNVGDTSVEEVDGRHQTSHVDRGTRVGDTVSRNVDEQLRETTKSIRYGLPPEGDGRDETFLGTSRV